MELIANLLANLGGAAAETGSSACILMMFDEPECPESLIK